jgi:ribose-phosphate pyrophosphokinase
MTPLVLSGSGNPTLAAALARALGWELGQVHLDRFPDGELQVEVHTETHGRDVYLVQSVDPRTEHTLLELLLLADAARRSGAHRLTGVLPYLAYARQDRRRTRREPLGARVIADLLQSVELNRLVILDLHSDAVESAFRLPLEHLSATDILVEHLRNLLPPTPVVVSPDLGAVRRSEAFARGLNLPVAIVHKTRLSGSEVVAQGVVGTVRGCSPIIVDDMVSTGATLEATVNALLQAGCAPEITVAITHPLFVGPALERLRRLPLRRVLTTDTVPCPPQALPNLEIVSVVPLLAQTLRRLGNPG